MDSTSFSQFEQPQGREVAIAAEFPGGTMDAECAVVVLNAKDSERLEFAMAVVRDWELN